MKRVLCWLFPAIFVLAGCGAAETPNAEASAAKDLAADAAAVYGAISETQNFTVTVEEPNGALTVLRITPDNARNVERKGTRLENSFAWSEAGETDWQAQLAAEDRGALLTLTSASGHAALRCCSGGDVVCWQQDGVDTYARAVNPLEGEPFEGKVYDDMRIIAEDAMSALVWSGTADGALDMAGAAAQLAEQVAEEYRNVSAWVSWRPLDVQVDQAAVYDAYLGTLEQFCFEVVFRVLLDEVALYTSQWSAGAGAYDQDADGYWHWATHVYVCRDREGDWYCAGRGTGGVIVQLPVSEEGEARLAQLVDAFYLTEGLSHEVMIPSAILELPEERQRELPGLLDRRTEEEAAALCHALAAYLRESPDTAPQLTLSGLRELLGAYGAYVDA